MSVLEFQPRDCLYTLAFGKFRCLMLYHYVRIYYGRNNVNMLYRQEFLYLCLCLHLSFNLEKRRLNIEQQVELLLIFIFQPLDWTLVPFLYDVSMNSSYMPEDGLCVVESRRVSDMSTTSISFNHLVHCL